VGVYSPAFPFHSPRLFVFMGVGVLAIVVVGTGVLVVIERKEGHDVAGIRYLCSVSSPPVSFVWVSSAGCLADVAVVARSARRHRQRASRLASRRGCWPLSSLAGVSCLWYLPLQHFVYSHIPREGRGEG